MHFPFLQPVTTATRRRGGRQYRYCALAAGPTTEELEITNITERHSNLISPAERTLTLSPSREPAMLPAWKRAREYVTYEAKSVPRYHPCSTQRPSTHGRLITGQRAPQGCKRPSVLAAPLQSQIEKRRREAARKPSVAAASREYTLYRAPKHMKVRVAPTSKVSRAAWMGGQRSLRLLPARHEPP